MAPGEAADDAALAERAHLAGIGLDDGGAEADLPVAGDHHAAAFAHGQDGGGVPGLRLALRCAGGPSSCLADVGVEPSLFKGCNRRAALEVQGWQADKRWVRRRQAMPARRLSPR